MTFYKNISSVYPYMISIRKLSKYMSFDMSFPNSWRFPKKYMPENQVVEIETPNPNERGISFVCDFGEESINNIILNVNGVIKYNKEREEKERLLEDKVNELKSIFEKQNLNSLKRLKFEISEQKIEGNGPEIIGGVSEGIVEE